MLLAEPLTDEGRRGGGEGGGGGGGRGTRRNPWRRASEMMLNTETGETVIGN